MSNEKVLLTPPFVITAIYLLAFWLPLADVGDAHWLSPLATLTSAVSFLLLSLAWLCWTYSLYAVAHAKNTRMLDGARRSRLLWFGVAAVAFCLGAIAIAFPLERATVLLAYAAIPFSAVSTSSVYGWPPAS